jgi:hypothetical protein
MQYNTIREYLKSVCSPDSLFEIVSDYEQFIQNGFIGDSLKRIGNSSIKALTGSDSVVRPTEWFKSIALESYRLLYENEKKTHEEYRWKSTYNRH